MAIKIEVEAEEKKEGEYDKWEIKRAMDTLMEAADIMEDKKLYKAVRAEMERQAGKIKSIQDIRDAASNFGNKKEVKVGKGMEDKSTPDDHAEDEEKEDRVKNSSNPTVVGRTLK